MSVSPHHKARTRSQVSGPLVTVLSISLACSLPRKPSTSLLPSDNPYAPTFFHRKPRDVPSSLSGFSLSTPSQIFCQTGHSHPTLPTSFLQNYPSSSLSHLPPRCSQGLLPAARSRGQEQGPIIAGGKEDGSHRELVWASGALALSSALFSSWNISKVAQKARRRETPAHKGGGKVRHRKPWESRPVQTIQISPNAPLPPWENLLVRS